jgi:hypothetical protein
MPGEQIDLRYQVPRLSMLDEDGGRDDDLASAASDDLLQRMYRTRSASGLHGWPKRPSSSARPPSDFSGAPRTCPRAPRRGGTDTRAPSSQQQTEEAST